MAAIDVGATMDAIAAALVASGVCTQAYAWPMEAPQVGEGIVDYFDGEIEFDYTIGRGSDRVTFPAMVICGMPQDRSTRDRVSTLMGSGATSIKHALDGCLSNAVLASYVPRASIVSYEPTGRPAQVAVLFDIDIVT